MHRRTFVRLLGLGTITATGVATGALDVERLLWIPGEKTLFLPPVAGWIPRGTESVDEVLERLVREGLVREGAYFDLTTSPFTEIIADASRRLADEIDRRALTAIFGDIDRWSRSATLMRTPLVDIMLRENRT